VIMLYNVDRKENTMKMKTKYRGFVSFVTSDAEFQEFCQKINRYYNWCGMMGLDPMDDDNYNSFCESDAVNA
jgi:hypothetical protein